MNKVKMPYISWHPFTLFGQKCSHFFFMYLARREPVPSRAAHCFKAFRITTTNMSKIRGFIMYKYSQVAQG